MPAKSDPRDKPAPTKYYYRRELTARELGPAIGAGIAVGLAVFYVARLYFQRTPLTAAGTESPSRRKRVGRSRGG